MNNKARGFFGEQPLPKFDVDPEVLRRRTRRDLLLFGAGAVAALMGGGDSEGRAGKAFIRSDSYFA